jgi:uncharacterized protein YjbI with pentapeptide repeats
VGAKVDAARFDNADLTHSIWMQAQGRNASFRGAVLYESVLQKAALVQCDFGQADVRYADFSDADVTAGQFQGAQMQRANLRGVNAEQAVMPNREQAAPDDADYVKAEAWKPGT